MATNYARSVWAYIGAFALNVTPTAHQPGLRRGMIYPFPGFDDIHDHPFSPIGIWPMAIPNPFTTDANGQALPAGLVAVLMNIGTYGSGDFNTRIDQWLQQQWTGGTPHSLSMYLVPGVLPAGYTRCLTTPWRSPWVGTSPPVMLQKFGDANGWTTQSWLPFSGPWGTGTGGIGLATWSPTAGSNPGYLSLGRSIGWRWLGMRAAFPGMGSTFFAGFGNVTFTISHNADGSDPGNANGDTIDGTITFTDGDFTNDGFGNWYTPPSTGSVSALASRGVVSTFVLKAENSDHSKGLPDHIGVFTSPRLDVPFPMTITGEGDLIAPGGMP